MALTVQKANFWKRISAYLFDVIITLIITVGVATVLSAALGYNRHNQALETYYTEYETNYGVDFDVSEEDYNNYSEEQKNAYNAASEAFRKDERVQAVYQKLFFLTLVIVSISLLLSLLTVYFIVPLFFKNGQTLGKKIFGLAVMRSNCVQASKPVLFIRTLFGLYTIETMFPVTLVVMIYFGVMGSVGRLTIGLLFLLQAGVLIASKNRSSIHDLLSDTVVVDMASQRIFATQEEMLAYKQAQHAEEAAKKDYI